jgi:hypothetical protein
MSVKRYLILREEYMIKMYGKRMWRRKFGLKWDDLIAGFRKLHNCCITSALLET